MTSRQYATIPPYGTPLLERGAISQGWYTYLSQSGQGVPAGPESAVTPTGSPFAYKASQAGSLLVSGGTVSSVTLNRSGANLATGQTSGMFALAAHDTVTITYSAKPTLTFVPA